MATRKKPAPAKRKPQSRIGRAVRLDLTEADHDRLQAVAEKLGLSKASYARMAVFERMKTDEAKG